MLKKIKRVTRKILGGKFAHSWRAFFDRKEMIKSLSVDKKRKQIQFPDKIAILFIGTNKYINFFPRYYETLKKFFVPKTKKDFFVFTDMTDFEYLKNKKNVKIVRIKHEKFPYVNLLKFKFINKAADKLKKYSHIIYIDADMYASFFIKENEFFSHDKPLFAVQHYNFVKKKADKQFERNPFSLAAVSDKDDLTTYWQACFWGGRSREFLQAIKELKRKTDIDIKNKIIAKWWDESFLNKYLIDNKKKVFTFNPSYSWPVQRKIPKPFKAKIIHVDENPPELKGKALKLDIRKQGYKTSQHS